MFINGVCVWLGGRVCGKVVGWLGGWSGGLVGVRVCRYTEVLVRVCGSAGVCACGLVGVPVVCVWTRVCVCMCECWCVGVGVRACVWVVCWSYACMGEV